MPFVSSKTGDADVKTDCDCVITETINNFENQKLTLSSLLVSPQTGSKLEKPSP